MGESFLEAAINRIVELAKPQTYKIGPYTYASQDLTLVDTEPSRPKDFCVDTLSGLVRIIKEEGSKLDVKLLVQVEDQRHVAVWSDYLGSRVERARKYDRWRLYTAEADVPRITVGNYMDQQQAIIELQSLHNATPDRDYLLDC